MKSRIKMIVPATIRMMASFSNSNLLEVRDVVITQVAIFTSYDRDPEVVAR